jgi:dipeptidyl aminopeptidase/acylaminoacyl peptidase
MAKIGSCYSPAFSPDGLQLAFVSNLSGLPQVWTVAADGGWPQLVTGLDDQVGGVQWSPDGRWLAFSLAPGGGMNTQVYLVRPDGRDLRRVTEGGKVNNQLDGWSHDGRLLLLSSNRADPESIDPYSFEVANGTLRKVASSHGVGSLADVSRDLRWGILDRVVARGNDNLYLVDLAGTREVLLTPHQGPASFLGGRFSPDGRTVYLGSNRDQDRIVFARLRLEPGGAAPAAGALETVAARGDAELEDFALTEDGRTAALVWNAGGRAELALLDLESGRPEPVALPGELAGGLTFSRNGRKLAMVVSGSRLPADVWVLDRASRRLHQVTHSPHAGVDLAALVAPELVRFPGEDGEPLSGWLYRPRNPGLRPPAAVLSFHGGPESEERPAFSSTYQSLLARGIAVFAPNVRGSAGFGKRFVNLDNGALRVNAVRDIRAAASWLAAQGIADPHRLGIMGGSYGGFMTMAGLTEFPDLFAAGADLFGIVNFETFFSHTEPWMAAISKIEYGDPATQRDLLRSLSPIHKLDRVTAPTLVLHGANDTNVPVVEAEQVVAALRQRGVAVEYVLFPDEGHGFRKTPNRIRAQVALVSWFDQHLKAPGAVAPAAPAAQR